MANNIFLKITYSQAPGVKAPGVEKLHQDLKEGGADFIKKEPEDAAPLILFASGVESGALAQKIADAPNLGIPPESAASLENLNLRLQALEEEHKDLAKELSEAYPSSETQIELSGTDLPGAISFVPTANGSDYEISADSSFGGLSVDTGPAREVASFALNALVAPVKKKIAEKVVAKAAVAVATKLGVKAAAAAATGPAAPVTAVLIEVGSRIVGAFKNALSAIGRWFKGEDSKEVRWFSSLALLFGGLYFLGSGNVVLGFPAVLAGGLSTLGNLYAAGVGTTAASFGSAVITGITSVALPAVGIPILVALVAVPLAVVLILFIINSGAYLVPPKTGTIEGLLSSPYIGVTKTADPAGPFENSGRPSSVTYTIEVVAKKGTLTNVAFSDDCQVIRRGTRPDCPTPQNITINGVPVGSLPTGPTPTPAAPVIISPVEPYIITYTLSFSSDSFTDSLTINTFTVTADADGGPNSQAAASAAIKIGDPPEECPNGWPVGGRFTQGAYSSSTHRGAEAIDIGANTGTAVTARHSGIVRALRGGPYGNHVEIESSCGDEGSFFSRYAHLSVISVNSGDTITTGEAVGLVGSTGNSTGPHLHYEFRGPSGAKSYPGNPPYMMPPFVPSSLTRGCVGFESCGSITLP